MGLHPLKVAREKKGISQTELSYLTKISTVRLSEIERWQRYPCPKWRDTLSRYFGIPEHELFPTPDDLLNMVSELQSENQALKQRIEMLSQKSSEFLHKSRDHSRYL